MKRTRLFLLTASVLCLLIAIGAINFTLSARAQQQHTEVKIDPKVFDQYTGQYSFVEDPELLISFWRESDKFYLQNNLNRTRIEIVPESETKFFPKSVAGTVTFVRDSQGNVSAILHENGVDEPAKKISDKPDIQV